MARKKDAAPAQGDSENEFDEGVPMNSETEDNDGQESSGEPLPAESVISAEVGAPAQGDLHKRLEKAAREAQTAPQHVHFPLHTVEMLMGRLKLALPDAIKATDDASLKADLESLLIAL